LQLFIIKKINE
jgi:hypothetical protein